MDRLLTSTAEQSFSNSAILMKLFSATFACLLLVTLIAEVRPARAGTLLVLNKSDNTVSLIEWPTKRLIGNLPTGFGPHEIAVSTDGRRAVVSNYGSQAQPGNSLTVIDIAAKRVAKTIDLGAYQRPHGITWLNKNEVAVTAEGSGALLTVDVASGKVTGVIPTLQKISHMVVVAHKLNRAFVANIGSGTVTVLDLNEREKIADIQTGAGAEGIDISPDEKEVWVTNRASNTVSIINARELEVAATLESKEFPIRVKFVPDGQYALVSNARSGDVALFDVKLRKEIKRVPMTAKAIASSADSQRIFGSQFGNSPVPVGILVAPELKHAFVANTNADVITAIDLKTWEIADRLTAGKEPDGLGYSRLSVK